jgi:LytS/YehU family sensor histidine kinase
MHHPVSAGGIFLGQLMRWWIWIPITPVIVALTRQVGRRVVPHLLLLAAVSAVTAVTWTAQALNNGDWQDQPLTTFQIIYPVSLNYALIGYTAIAGVTMAVDARRRSAELQKQLDQARLVALTRQLQPHFLFNTLHSIASLVRTGRGPEAVETIARLSALLRESLDAEQAPEVELGREIEASALYLDIQQTRFSDRMRVERHLAPETLSALVPRFILQPLLENAVSHGIAVVPEAGTVGIRSAHRGDRLVIEVSNSGPPLPRGWSIETSARVGLRNTLERLCQLYGALGTISLANTPGGVTAEIAIPWSKR